MYDDIMWPFRVDDGVKINSKNYCQFLVKTFMKQWFNEKQVTVKKLLLLTQDNILCHASKYMKSSLAKKGFKVDRLMSWPPCTSDINLIDNPWTILKREIYTYRKQYHSLDAV
jgi:hypothetical protein